MKRTLSILAGVAILAVAGYFGGWGWAQYTQDAEITPPGVKTAGGPLRTRVAVLNMVKVLKKYKKFETYDTQYKAAQKSYAEPLEKLNAELIAKTAEQAKPSTDASRKQQLEQEITRIKRDLEDKDKEARKALTKLNGDMMVTIYKEVEEMVREYARRYEIDMVLYYNDALADADFHSAMNVQRKVVNFASLMPLYFDSRMDISEAIIYNLNQKVASTQPIVPTSTRGGQ